MPSNQSTYREQVDLQRVLKIREILRGLPQTCSDFINGIALTTSTFTRLAYTIDLRTFFEYLHTERVAYIDTPLTLMTAQQISQISLSDFNAYTEYLTYYFKHPETDGADNQPLKPIQNHEIAIKRKLSTIRSFYDYLYKNQHISANPAALITLPKIHEKPIIRLNQDEMVRMLEKSTTGDGLSAHQKKYQKITATRDFALLSLFLGTGIRVSECVGLNLEDIDLENNAFLVTRKGGNEVVLYLPPEVATAIADYVAVRNEIKPLEGHENALFLSLQRRRITQRAVQNLVKKYAAVAAPLKSKISPHKLRSTFATNLYNQTGDIYLVADVLGHTSVDTTRKHYADLKEERRRMAAEYVTLPTIEEIAAKTKGNASDQEKKPKEET